ncbi:MAG: DUF6778 family protein [Pseudooceanicola sp.]
MKILKTGLILAVLTGVSGCMTMNEATTRNAPFENKLERGKVAPNYLLTGFTVNVPRTLTVSEANAFYPNADVVWRGEPLGDRREQVNAIMSKAAQVALQGTGGDVPAIVDIEITQFHALTEKARYSTGGWHTIAYTYSLRDPETGAVIAAPQKVKTTFGAYGGDRALQADAAGHTQKARITSHLINSLRKEVLHLGPLKPSTEVQLTQPEPPKLHKL